MLIWNQVVHGRPTNEENLMLTISQKMLNDVQSPAEKKAIIWQRLLAKIETVKPTLGIEITGILLEMDNKDLLKLLNLHCHCCIHYYCYCCCSCSDFSLTI